MRAKQRSACLARFPALLFGSMPFFLSPRALLRSIKDIENDRKEFPDFKQQSDEGIAAAALILGISVFVGHGARLAAWIQRGIGADPAVLTMNGIVLVGAIALAAVSFSDRCGPYLSFFAALEHFVLDAASCITFHLYLVSGAARQDCLQLESELVMAELCAQFALVSFVACLAGYTRLGALALLWKPVALGVLLLLPPYSASSGRFLTLGGWRFVVLCLFISIAAVVCSVHLTTSQWRAFHAQANSALAKVREHQREHSNVINHVVRNSLNDAKAELVLLLDGESDSQCQGALQAVIAILAKGIRWCRSHVACTSRLAAGPRRSLVIEPVNLRTFADRVVADRPVRTAISQATIQTDPVLLDVMIENALANAAKRGDPTDPHVLFTVTATDCEASSTGSGAGPLPVAPARVLVSRNPPRAQMCLLSLVGQRESGMKFGADLNAG